MVLWPSSILDRTNDNCKFPKFSCAKFTFKHNPYDHVHYMDQKNVLSPTWARDMKQENKTIYTVTVNESFIENQITMPHLSTTCKHINIYSHYTHHAKINYIQACTLICVVPLLAPLVIDMRRTFVWKGTKSSLCTLPRVNSSSVTLGFDSQNH